MNPAHRDARMNIKLICIRSGHSGDFSRERQREPEVLAAKPLDFE